MCKTAFFECVRERERSERYNECEIYGVRKRERAKKRMRECMSVN
jgi:hypothetical protein